MKGKTPGGNHLFLRDSFPKWTPAHWWILKWDFYTQSQAWMMGYQGNVQLQGSYCPSHQLWLWMERVFGCLSEYWICVTSHNSWEENAFNTVASYSAQGWGTMDSSVRLSGFNASSTTHCLCELIYNIFESQFSHVQNEDMNTHFVILLRGSNIFERIKYFIKYKLQWPWNSVITHDVIQCTR